MHFGTICITHTYMQYTHIYAIQKHILHTHTYMHYTHIYNAFTHIFIAYIYVQHTHTHPFPYLKVRGSEMVNPKQLFLLLPLPALIELLEKTFNVKFISSLVQ